MGISPGHYAAVFHWELTSNYGIPQSLRDTRNCNAIHQYVFWGLLFPPEQSILGPYGHHVVWSRNQMQHFFVNFQHRYSSKNERTGASSRGSPAGWWPPSTTRTSRRQDLWCVRTLHNDTTIYAYSNTGGRKNCN